MKRHVWVVETVDVCGEYRPLGGISLRGVWSTRKVARLFASSFRRRWGTKTRVRKYVLEER